MPVRRQFLKAGTAVLVVLALASPALASHRNCGVGSACK